MAPRQALPTPARAETQKVGSGLRQRPSTLPGATFVKCFPNAPPEVEQPRDNAIGGHLLAPIPMPFLVSGLVARVEKGEAKLALLEVPEVDH